MALPQRTMFGNPRRPRGPRQVTALPPGSVRGKDAEMILAAELLAELRATRIAQTRDMARLAGNIINDVLSVGSATFDASGALQLDWHVACGSIEVENIGTHLMWVTAAGIQPFGYVPGPGLRITPVPAGSHRSVSVASRVVTIYGTAGDVVGWQAYTRGSAPTSSLGSVIGGGP